MSSTVPLAFAVITFTLAYLSINTPEEYASLQVGNYILTYILMLFTGFLSYAFANSNESQADLLAAFASDFSWVAVLVVAVFLIKIVNAVLEATGKEVI